MRNIVVGFSTFTIALAIGIFLGIDSLPISELTTPVEQNSISSLPPVITEKSSVMPDISPSNLAELEWSEQHDSKFKIQLLELGEAFHGDQVNAKSGESWIGLFRKNNHYFLKTTKIKITAAHDVVVDGKDERIKTGKTVATATNLPAVFLLKNVRGLREGAITTLFYADPNDDEDNETGSLKNGTTREFDFNGSHYVLRVENQLSQDEFLEKGSKLVLVRDGREQVLRYLKDGCDDCSWSLNWVGDVDRDGKLDYYFQLNGHYNSIDQRLFLSSKAKQGELLRYVARFWTNGC